MERSHAVGWMDRAVVAIALVILILGAGGGPGWTSASADAVLATQLERTASAPLYGLVASVAAMLPAGEPGFRLAILGAVLGALLLLGVIRATRMLLPEDPVAGVVAAILVALAPPFREAAGFAGPSILAACGGVWAFALAAAHAREPSARRAAGALACLAIVIGSAPWLGIVLGIAIVAWLARSAAGTLLAIGVGAIGLVAILLWIGAIGRLPALAPSAASVMTATSGGATTIVVGAGLLGAAFAVVTRLAHARRLALVLALAVAHAIAIDHDPMMLVALLGIASAVIPAAVVRMLPDRRHVVAAVAGVPLIAGALLTGPAFAVDDPGDAPARLATDLIARLPPGPGVVVATRPTTWAAIQYAQLVAGARPDLVLIPPMTENAADIVVADALRGDRIAGADVFVFGRLDPQRALPRGRGFQLLGARPAKLASIPKPARYASAVGEAEAVHLAIDLARYEAGFGRLDAAAHAAGLAGTRFGAADLALLSISRPSLARPAFFGFIPAFPGDAVGPWMLDLLGDDLAWVAGLEPPPGAQPPARKLHALWRALWQGAIEPDDPQISALGPAAVKATREMLASFGK